MSKPLAVLISDVHYSLNNLELSDRAFREAIDTAAELNVPLIDCGDLTNDKAILRGEVVNVLLETFKYAKQHDVEITCVVGNHSLLNEKSSEHSLNFLSDYADIIEDNGFHSNYGLCFIPYQSNSESFLKALKIIPKGTIVITHQGFKGANKGDYIIDKSAIDVDLVKNYKIFSGHYHCHQNIGTVTYVGNPFTMSFGEASDGPKGYLIINEDGTYEQKVLDFRKHSIVNLEIMDNKDIRVKGYKFNEEDLVWIKIIGKKHLLENWNKERVRQFLGIENFKLDKIYTEDEKLEQCPALLTGENILDSLIDKNTSSNEKAHNLKNMWRNILENTPN